ncbi:MAG TPA: cupin domain-containing protein [Bryobacteraceae bacterium]|nr:cupin domain-containing protein [Bryobacteraceae bacterium]
MAIAGRIDPTWLHRDLSSAREINLGSGCHYKALFGEGDADKSAVAGIARYGEVMLDPKGACSAVSLPQDDQIYVVLEGSGKLTYGADTVALEREDYVYIPEGTRHALSNASEQGMRVIVMGFHTKGLKPAPAPQHPLKANIEDAPLQTVSGHPSSTLYRLLLGDVNSKRDRIAAGRAVTSLFLMEIAPGGTNFPHHHPREEEIYLVLEGHGDMIAGGGMDGIEGRHPAKRGDAYFFRPNCTVGYYSAPGVKSRVLAVRSWYPGMANETGH